MVKKWRKKTKKAIFSYNPQWGHYGRAAAQCCAVLYCTVHVMAWKQQQCEASKGVFTGTVESTNMKIKNQARDEAWCVAQHNHITPTQQVGERAACDTQQPATPTPSRPRLRSRVVLLPYCTNQPWSKNLGSTAPLHCLSLSWALLSLFPQIVVFVQHTPAPYILGYGAFAFFLISHCVSFCSRSVLLTTSIVMHGHSQCFLPLLFYWRHFLLCTWSFRKAGRVPESRKTFGIAD